MTTASPFDAAGFLALAGELVESPTAGEAAHRTAVSRAYYAVHLKAREALRRDGRLIPTRTGRDHRLVIETLRNGGGAAGDQLDRLRLQRARADYDLSAPTSDGDARAAVGLAGALLNSLEKET